MCSWHTSSFRETKSMSEPINTILNYYKHAGPTENDLARSEACCWVSGRGLMRSTHCPMYCSSAGSAGRTNACCNSLDAASTPVFSTSLSCCCCCCCCACSSSRCLSASFSSLSFCERFLHQQTARLHFAQTLAAYSANNISRSV